MSPGSIVGDLPSADYQRARKALLGHTWTPREAEYLTRLVEAGTRRKLPLVTHYAGIPIRVLRTLFGDKAANFAKPYYDPFEAMWTFWLGADARPTPREMAHYDPVENKTIVFVWDED